jgi:hypothetical protein
MPVVMTERGTSWLAYLRNWLLPTHPRFTYQRLTTLVFTQSLTSSWVAYKKHMGLPPRAGTSHVRLGHPSRYYHEHGQLDDIESKNLLHRASWW